MGVCLLRCEPGVLEFDTVGSFAACGLRAEMGVTRFSPHNGLLDDECSWWVSQ